MASKLIVSKSHLEKMLMLAYCGKDCDAYVILPSPAFSRSALRQCRHCLQDVSARAIIIQTVAP